MLTLLLASLLSWYLIIQRGSVLKRTERQFDAFVQRFRGSAELTPLYRESLQQADGEGGVEPIFQAGFQAYSQLRQQGGNPAEVVLEGVERSLYVAISEQEIRLEKACSSLPRSVQSAPIGLFGTVWGS